MTADQAHVADEFLKVQSKLRVYALSLTRDRDRADDLVQEVFLRAVDKAHQYKAGTNFAAWIFTLARNHHISHGRLRRNKTHEDISEVRIATPQRQEDGIRFRELAQLLRLLPKQNRTILLMAGLDGMSLDEIANRTGLELGTVKSRISRARDLLDGGL